MNSYLSSVSIGRIHNLENANEEILVTAAREGDHLPFSELWNHHSKRAFHTMYRITRNQQDAEDALQDAFLKAFVHLKHFDGRSMFSTWLTRISDYWG